MNKSVIAIHGSSNLGKSETVRETANLLLAAFPNHTIHAINTDADITYIVDINGVKIGIESQGGLNNRMFQSLQTFVAEGCDIIICSCSSIGATAEAVEDLHRHHQYEIIWSTNHRSLHKNQTQLNQIATGEILELIKLIMNGQL
ncbi:hypothetical protein FAZ15_17340 [Sphingobacterium olei]|uniref:Uncharacterized protein n=1 Tax=Sphingobacterium olei TaxID=2571155 RepID=A0A4V5MKL8_9SPHI|nr:hypothetical protein [Sphingobacterium olei]TJZ53788.1 hypothetical protein FAZ15_17340 [Sphingobacterium olei]